MTKDSHKSALAYTFAPNDEYDLTWLTDSQNPEMVHLNRKRFERSQSHNVISSVADECPVVLVVTASTVPADHSGEQSGQLSRPGPRRLLYQLQLQVLPI